MRVVEYALDTPAGPGTERYRLVTSLLDPAAFSAMILAATYHERWEVETALAEVKVHQWAHPAPYAASTRGEWCRRSMACSWPTSPSAP